MWDSVADELWRAHAWGLALVTQAAAGNIYACVLGSDVLGNAA
jgi:hypothetical protein